MIADNPRVRYTRCIARGRHVTRVVATWHGGDVRPVPVPGDQLPVRRGRGGVGRARAPHPRQPEDTRGDPGHCTVLYTVLCCTSLYFQQLLHCTVLYCTVGDPGHHHHGARGRCCQERAEAVRHRGSQGQRAHPPGQGVLGGGWRLTYT